MFLGCTDGGLRWIEESGYVVGSTLGTLQHGAPLDHHQVHPQYFWALDTQREGVREVVWVEVVVVLVVVVAI